MKMLPLLAMTFCLSCFAKESLYDVTARYGQPANIEVSFRVGDSVTQKAPDMSRFKINKVLNILEDGNLLSNSEGSKLELGRPQSFNFDILVVIDLSGSVAGSLDKIREAATSFVETTLSSSVPGRRINISLRSFDGSEKLAVHTDFTSNLGVIKQAIAELAPGEDPSTNLNGAISESVDLLINRKSANSKINKKALVFFTDGKDQAERMSESEAVKALERAKSYIEQVYAVAVDGELSENFLKNFGEKDSGYFIIDHKLKKLTSVFQKISNTITGIADSYFVARICTPKRKGIHYLTLQTSEKSFNVEFSAKNFEKGCDVLDEGQWSNLTKESVLLSDTRMQARKSFYNEIDLNKAIANATPEYDSRYKEKPSDCTIKHPVQGYRITGLYARILEVRSTDEWGVEYLLESQGTQYKMQCSSLPGLEVSSGVYKYTGVKIYPKG